MKTTLLFALLVLLVVPAGSCTTSLLRLQRSEELGPGAVWEQVPANVLPVTEGGAFLHTYEAAAGFYRMRIDPAVEWGFPLSMPLEDVPATGVGLAQELLDSLREMEGDVSWEDAVLGPVAFPMYAPGVDDPAYMEFAVLAPQPKLFGSPFDSGGSRSRPPARSLQAPPPRQSRLTYDPCDSSDFVPRGRILVSLTEDDIPIVEYSTHGGTRTECLRNLAKSSAVRIVKIPDGFTVAENEQGELLAYFGSPPVYYPDDILDLCDREFEGWGDEQFDESPEPPAITGHAYASYQAFKTDYLESRRFQVARNRLKEATELLWDIEMNRIEPEKTLIVTMDNEVSFFEQREVKSAVLDDPSLAMVDVQQLGVLIYGTKLGHTTLHVEFADAEKVDYTLIVAEMEEPQPTSGERPTGWTAWKYHWADAEWAQRWYTQEDGDDCPSGCGATAWAMLYGWFDKTGRCDMIEGSPPTDTPLYNNWAVRQCIWYIVPRIESYCVGSQAATNPWNMYKGYKRAEFKGYHWWYDYAWTAPCFGWTWSGPRTKAAESLRDDKTPAIIGIWCTTPHYPLAYGYAWRYYKILGYTVWTSRRFRVNLGWGGPTDWIDADGVFFGMRANFWP